ncbi:hypothetical protein HYDPIDRAFT_110213 [Hydnomerulius pinastri MD-312]|nr:hypothetical protein HYDPIDRAFT_110213 [Hydnomerulius pinastri MD-312]
MPVVVVTVTSAVTVTPTSTPTSSGGSSLNPGTIAGIVIGALLGFSLLAGLVIYLLHRRSRGQFTKVPNPPHDRSMSRGLGSTPGIPGKRSIPSVRERPWFGHPQQPSVSLEPLLSSVQWPAHTSPQARSPDSAPRRSDSLSPGLRALPEVPAANDGRYSLYDDGFDPYTEIGHVVASGTVAHRGQASILSIPPARKPEAAVSRRTHAISYDLSANSRIPSDHQPARTSPRPVTIGTYDPDSQAEASSSAQSRPSFFLNRILKSRADASEPLSPASQHSLDYTQSRSTTMDSSYDRADAAKSLADAEQAALAALRDAEQAAQRGQEGGGSEGSEDEEPDSPASEYSQLSAPIDHAALLSSGSPFARQASTRSLGRRKSSRRRARTPALPVELPPVAELPDTPRTYTLSASRPASTVAHSSLEVAISHGKHSRPSSLALDQPASFPLLTSTAFGKSSSASASSVSSNAGWGSNSSDRASRYPSLAPSSIAMSSGSHPHSEGGTDWHHLPPGLAALKNLQAEPLRNPHSPVESPVPPFPSDISLPLEIPKPEKRAHLREGTASSLPEVERRAVTQGGIASIDVAL